jgi:GWxTD domain-containing protein
MHCTTNIFAPHYYRLLEKERQIYLGLQGIEPSAARKYLYLESPTERAHFYENFWRGKEAARRREFEERVEYAYRTFGKHAPLSDDRIPIYVKYGPPSRREKITPQKKVGIKTKEHVKHAEIWIYNADGFIFDFVRIARSYKNIAQSEFGEKIRIPYLKEIADSSILTKPTTSLDFEVTIGKFRQKKNLTRLEIYITVDIEDTTDLTFARDIQIYDIEDRFVDGKANILRPEESANGKFYDEINFWLRPEKYRLEIELIDIKNQTIGKKSLSVDLIEYLDDVKEISDLIPAKLIDDAYTHEKFNKPVGRVIPLTQVVLPVHKLFYLYTEVYNLGTKDGMHQLITTYEVYNKEKMRKEIVDVMIKDIIEPGDVAYLAAEYHPMDLSPGHYIIVVKIKDLISDKERTAVTEFQLVSVD